MSTKPNPPEAVDDKAQHSPAPTHDEPGTNAVEHEPDPDAKPLPDGRHKHVPRSPYTAGNY